jgi:hypothetical protein
LHIDTFCFCDPFRSYTGRHGCIHGSSNVENGMQELFFSDETTWSICSCIQGFQLAHSVPRFELLALIEYSILCRWT